MSDHSTDTNAANIFGTSSIIRDAAGTVGTLLGLMVARNLPPRPPTERLYSAARILRDYGGGLPPTAFKVVVMRSRAARMAAYEGERQDYRRRLDDYNRRAARREAEAAARAERRALDLREAEAIQALIDDRDKLRDALK